MAKLMKWYNLLERVAIKDIMEFYNKFERVHKFQDENI